METSQKMEKDNNNQPHITFANEVIDLNKTTSIVVKINSPNDAIKKKEIKSDETQINEIQKSSKPRLCQLIPILLFLVTFATVLSLLILYLDPSSKYLIDFEVGITMNILSRTSYSKPKL